MKVNSKLKSKKFNQNLFRQIEALEGKIKAGYPKESKETFEEDLNGHTPLFKATEINFSEKNIGRIRMDNSLYSENVYEYEIISILRKIGLIRTFEIQK